jgi:hypothetical protein
LPVCVFIVAAELHFGWQALNFKLDPAAVCAPEATDDRECCQSPGTSAFDAYLKSQSYWLGVSYALPMAFAAVALRRWRERRSSRNRNLALGGVTLSGALATAGCFLTGCCGSPMLAIYATFLGPTFLPFAKPLLAAVSGISVLIAWWWMDRPAKAACNCSSSSCCGGDVTSC